MKKRIIPFIAGIALLTAVLISCSDPEPTAEIFATIDGYTVTFNPTVANADTYLWDFGDDSAESTEMKPSHTYESFGDYTVTLTVTGEGGEYTATKIVTIEATSVKDLLTGGANAADGKTWVLSTVVSPGFDGGGRIMDSPYTLEVVAVDEILTILGLGAEYDNEFTFYFDGTYKMNLKNGKALAGLIYSNAMEFPFSEYNDDIGMCAAEYSVPTNATWTLHTNDLVIDAIADHDDANNPPAHGNVTISSDNGWVSLSTGAFFGILDYPTTAQFVIDEITANKMKVSMFLCGYWRIPDYFSLPSDMIHLTYVKK